MTPILIEVDELIPMLDDANVVIVDTRAPCDYEKSHIQGAINIHEIFTFLASSTSEGAKDMRQTFANTLGNAGISNNNTIIFYEQSMDSGYGQSCRGYFLLRYLGHTQARVLHGGYQAWQSKALNTTTAQPLREKKVFNINDSGLSLIVGKDDVFNALGKNTISLVDVRDVDEWIGESSSPYGKDFAPRKGRIPGAIWLEWYRMMKPTADGARIKSPNEIKAECLNIGLDVNKPIWLYCFKGARTSNAYVALTQAGFTRISTYFGSWNEWSQDLNMPIEEGLPK